MTAEAPDILDSPEAAQRMIRGSALRTVSYIVSVLAGVAALPLLFRHLGVVETGRYVTVITLVTIVGAVVETGLAGISVREFARAPAAGRRALMADLIGLRLAALALAAACAVAFMAVAGYGSVLLAGATVALVGTLFESLSSTYGVSLSASLRLGWLAAMLVVRQTVAVVLTLLLVLVEAPLIWFFALLIVASLAQWMVGWFATRSTIPHLPSRDARAWRDRIRGSAPYLGAMVLGVVYFRAAMILMALLSTEVETGYFGVPFRLLEIVTLVAVMLMSSALPILARSAQRDPVRYRHALSRLSEVGLIAGAWVAAVTLVASGLVIEVLAGPGFEPSAAVLRVLTVSLALKFVVAGWALALLSLEAYGAMLMANAAAMAVALVVSVVAVPALGATGGALATVAADLVIAGGYAWALRGAVHGSAIPGRTLRAVVLATGCAIGAALLTPGPDLARAALVTLVYGGIVLATKALPRELAVALPKRRTPQKAAI